MMTFKDCCAAYGWDANADIATLNQYLNKLGNEQAYAYAVGLDDTVKIIEKVINILEEEIENRELVASGYQH